MWADHRLDTMRTHRATAWLVPLGIFLAVLLIGIVDAPVYDWLIHEDGPLESATMLLALVASVVAAIVAVGLRNRSAPTWLVTGWALFAVALFVLAGEEASWGQRQIGFSGPESLTSHNLQNESNVHNLLAPWALSATYTLVGVYGAGVGNAVLRRIRGLGRFADLLAPSWWSVAAPWFGVHALVYAWYSVVEPIVRAVGIDFSMDDHLRKLGEPSEFILGVAFLLFAFECLVSVKLGRRSTSPTIDHRERHR